MNRNILKSLSFLVLFFPIVVLAQKTVVYENPMADYKLALELFNKGKYGAARDLFSKTIERISDEESKIRINSQYYRAICALELFNPDAEKLLTDFIFNYPTHSLQSIASFQMGNLQYRKRNYEEALHWFSRVELYDLDAEQRVELQFKTGYSHFMNEDYQQAKHYFFDIRNPESVYYPPATYYYGHISYSEENYETALMYFQRLNDDENFGPIVPYYITHIYFLQEKYDELIEFAPPLLEQASTRRAAEISRMIGEAYYNMGEFAQSIPYLEQYHSQTRQSITREEHYQLGFAYYKANEFEKAVTSFEKVTNAEDTLAQNALYHLADAYLETDQRRSARNAFMSAHRMEFIPEITENSLFNYAKLSFELSMNPFNEAILSFQKYVENYPNSPRIDEAYKHLIDLYLTTRNYKDALTSMEAITLNTPVLKSAYQRVAYYRGIELFNNGDFPGSIEHFEKSLRHPENRTIRAQSIFWQGEAQFRLEQYEQSIETLARFQLLQGAFSLPEFNKAHYTIGYANFKLQNYPQAITAFRKFVQERNLDPNLQNDAFLRIADSYFVTKDYNAAIEFYDRAIALQKHDTDYAIFQKAVAMGVTARFDSKINTLQELLRNYPNTSYADNARYELGNTYVIQDNNARALQYYNELITRHPNSSYVKSAMLKTGLIHFNQNEDERALAIFRSIAEKYPGTPEAQEALVSLRNIYIALDQVDQYVTFTEEMGLANVTKAQQDSLTYIAAENRYMQGDCTNASQSFEAYLEKFPDGIFALNAHFYKAECDFRSEELQKALASYQFVLTKPKSKFSENAALRAAQINFGLNQYQAALENYQLLEEIAEFPSNLQEAKTGQMRALDKLQRHEQTIEAANRVLENDKISRELRQEANLLIAGAALSQNNLDMAKQYYTETNQIAENHMAAEAKYHLALIEFRKGNYQECEKLIFEYIDVLAAYDYWLARIFILLADNYLVQDNIFQARHTLQSIIDNYDGEELRQEAIEKLAGIDRQEELRNMKAEPDTLEIDFSEKERTNQ
ncbi:MAG: tetratricopeptide repeat protein [Bacteroidota bacterium]